MPAQNFSACTAIDQHFLRESGRIGPETYQRGREVDPIWLGLFPQKPWHDHMGVIIKNTIYERSGLNTPPTWNAVNPSDGASTNACLPPLTVISNSATTQEYQRYHIALESDPLCLEDLRNSNNIKQAVAAFQDNLMGNANYVRKERIRSEYQRLSRHKVVVTAGLPEDDDAFPLVQPTSPMTLGVLRRTYPRLLREFNGTSGTERVATGSRGAPNFIYVGSLESIENMVKTNEDIRNDFRWSDRVNELLGSYGDQVSYGGFILREEPFPERYNWTGSAFIRVPEYTPSATTLGNKLEINPYWEHAQFEVSYIIVKEVMTNRVPNPMQTFGEGKDAIKYQALNYALEWRWINRYDRNCNPDENIGFFRAVGMHASEPGLRQFGWAFMALRCDAALDLVSCPSGSGYSSGPFV